MYLHPDTEQSARHDETSVQVGPARLQFHRTLRVADNAKTYMLPPVRFTVPGMA